MSKSRTIFTKVALPVCQLIVGGLGGLGAIALVNPSEEVRVGPIVVEQTIDIGEQSTFLGEDLLQAPPFVVDVDIKLIDRSDYPHAIEEVKNIYTNNEGEKQTPEEIRANITELYGNDFDNDLRELALKTFGCFAIGSTVSVYALRRSPLFPKSEERKPGNGHHIDLGKALAYGLLTSALVMPTSYLQIDQAQVPDTVEGIVSAPIDQYLLTGTSKMVVDFDSINNEIAKQLQRILGIEQAIRKAVHEANPILDGTQADTQTALIVSDPHNLPSAPKLIEELARARNVDFILILGDFENTGADVEEDSLFGYTIGDTYFQGYDEIRTCIETIRGICEKEGKQFDIYALSGNHDTRKLVKVFSSLGMKDLSNDPPPIFEGQIAMHDECFVEEDICRNAHDEVNKNAAEQLRAAIDFDSTANTPPTIGFFAKDSAANVFKEDLPIIIYGGTHEFSAKTRNGQKVLEIGTVGSGFPRGAKYSNAVIAEFSRDDDGLISMDDCTSVKWDLFDSASRGISVDPCFK